VVGKKIEGEWLTVNFDLPQVKQSQPNKFNKRKSFEHFISGDSISREVALKITCHLVIAGMRIALESENSDCG
jgi:hypothetical protein